jgi:hypothetical protein
MSEIERDVLTMVTMTEVAAFQSHWSKVQPAVIELVTGPDADADAAELTFLRRLGHEKSQMIDRLRADLSAVRRQIDAAMSGADTGRVRTGSDVEKTFTDVLDDLAHDRLSQPAAEQIKDAAQGSIKRGERSGALRRAIRQ